MAIDWIHLSFPEVLDKVCISGGCGRGTKNSGFSLDPETGYWVCANCRKPSRIIAVQECDNCGKAFVPKFYSKIQQSFLGIECDECDPPRQSR